MTSSTGKSLTYNSIIWKLFIYGRGENSRAGNIPRLLKMKNSNNKNRKNERIFYIYFKSR